MLNELDKEMEKRGLYFVRYADDCIILIGSEMSANRVTRNTSRFIEEKLGIKVNATKNKVDKPQGLKYFFTMIESHKCEEKRHSKPFEKFKKRMGQLISRSWSVSNSYKIRKFKIGSMKILCKELDGNVRYKLCI